MCNLDNEFGSPFGKIYTNPTPETPNWNLFQDQGLKKLEDS